MSDDEDSDVAAADAEDADAAAAGGEDPDAGTADGENGDGATADAEDGDAAAGDAEDGSETTAADDKGLVERIAEHDEDLAQEVRRLAQAAIDRGERIDDLEAHLEAKAEEIDDLEADLEAKAEEIDDLTDRLKRKQADFQNYKKRQQREKERIRERATEDLVERLLDVRENLKRAVDNDHEDVESIREGVEMTLSEFDRVLEDENVTEIAPDPGDEVDPQRHEVMLQTDSDHPDGTIADVYASGYEMADEVLKPAQVTVSTGPADGAAGEADGDGGQADADADDRTEN